MGNTPGKKPPAPSAKRRAAVTEPDIRAQIALQIYIALERLDADPDLLAIVGSWCDTLDDAEVLALLQEYKASGRVLHRPR
jgi:hypothetical protein